MNFTSGQRRNTLAVSTEDIARSEQIFLSREARMDELARHASFLAGNSIFLWKWSVVPMR